MDLNFPGGKKELPFEPDFSNFDSFIENNFKKLENKF